MKALKIILGVILGLGAINAMIVMGGEESGAGLAGAVTGFVILGGIAGWLIYSGMNHKSK